MTRLRTYLDDHMVRVHACLSIHIQMKCVWQCVWDLCLHYLFLPPAIDIDRTLSVSVRWL